MLSAQSHVRTVACFRLTKAESNSNAFNVTKLIPNSNIGCLSIHFGLKRNSQFGINGGRKPIVVSCKSPFDGQEQDRDFLPASLLLSETAIHHRMRKKGFEEEKRWRLPGRWDPFKAITGQPETVSSFVGQEFLCRFKSPTIFLKVCYNGEFLLPITVGEFAIEKLLDTFQLRNEERKDCPDQFQLVRNLVENLGYQVKMVKIIQSEENTYLARVFLSKEAENDILSMDARPTDAINMANRCQAPIYVRKQIVATDAIRISYGIRKEHDEKPIYDASLDHATTGPDLLSEELDLVKNMNLAVEEERYDNAAMWRDKLMKLRQARHAH